MTIPSLAMRSEPSRPAGVIFNTVPSFRNLDSNIVRESLFLFCITSRGISVDGTLTSLVSGISESMEFRYYKYINYL